MKYFPAKKIFLASISLTLSPLVLADATVVYEQISNTQKSVNTMQLKDGKIRFTPPSQNKNYSLYNSQTGTLTHVDVANKQYLKMNEDDIAQQANQAKMQMEKMRQLMLEKMKDMPPAQQKQVEQMMNKHLAQVEAQKNPKKTTQKKTTRSETIAGIQCTVYESFIDGIKNNELCLAQPDALGLNNTDAKALMAMQSFMQRMQKVAQAMMGNNAENIEIKGIPLRTKLFAQDGSVKLETHMTSLSTDSIKNEQVSIPDGFSAMQKPVMSGMK